MIDNGAYLLVKKGDPTPFTTRKYLTKDHCTIGRRGTSFQLDITFNSPYISRMHAAFHRIGNDYKIIDLESKHGTEVNGTPLQYSSHILRHGDQISLSKGVAELVFLREVDRLDDTVELLFTQPKSASLVPGLEFHLERREVRFDGTRLHLTGKDMDLLKLLYQKANSAVSFEEIMLAVWPERLLHDGDVPDVGRVEVNALVYRLRKKLGSYGQQITTIPRYGYRFDF
ncbi:FHA domain-containing protein [Brevibacillus brevis]|uniref:FHA domain-containing protein n=1 Tax=Brevibacillus brevis TaxID=1393 RepID=A0A517IA07_BREBE|nr:FHA domain-containing protein [Brevibacillus brevis]QDS35713.1 FHA domain-containing protein [Brevibacillus brevis]